MSAEDFDRIISDNKPVIPHEKRLYESQNATFNTTFNKININFYEWLLSQINMAGFYSITNSLVNFVNTSTPSFVTTTSSSIRTPAASDL